MIRQVLGLTALLGLKAGAFMIPSTMSLPDIEGGRMPEISDLFPAFEASNPGSFPTNVEDNNAFLDTDVETITVFPIVEDPAMHMATGGLHLGLPYSVITNIDCPECSSKWGPLGETLGSASSQVSLVFSIDMTGEQLLLNNAPLYPLGEIAPTFTAPEKPYDALLDATQPSHELRYQAAVVPGPIDPQTGDQTLDVWYKVAGIDDVDTDVEPIKISIFKQPSGQLAILNVSFDPEMPNEFLRPEDKPEENCAGPAIFCKLFHTFEDKISAWRSRLHSSKPCHSLKGHNFDELTMPPLHGGIPKFTFPPMGGHSDMFETDDFHRHHHHHHHHHHERLHAFMQGVHNFLIGFLVPVLIGIMAGMFASVVGMVLGSFVAWVWIRFVRGGKRGPYAAIPASDEAAEKSATLSSDENEDFAPPAYEEKA